MTTKLLQFAEHLLNDPKTKINLNSSYEKLGFSVDNPEWNCKLIVFSDRENNFYFELHFFSTLDGKTSFDKNPTFITDDITSIRSLLNTIVRKYEVTQNVLIKESEEYLDLFHKVLRGDPLPSNYVTAITDSSIELRQNNKIIGEILNKDILDFQHRIDILREPMASQGLCVREIGKEGFVLHLTLPKYSLSEYKVIKRKPKDICVITSSVDDWFEKIKEFENVPQTSVHKTIEYINLNSELQLNSDDLIRKKKPKL